MNIFEIISQFAIPICTGSSVYLLSRTDKWNRWGYVLGLCSQPFWFYTTISNKQYGLFVLSCWCTFSWCNGIYKRFYKKEEIKLKLEKDL